MSDTFCFEMDLREASKKGILIEALEGVMGREWEADQLRFRFELTLLLRSFRDS